MHSNDPISSRTTRFVQTAFKEDISTIKELISQRRIHISIQPGQDDSFVWQLILFTLLNLLIRLDSYCPTLSVAIPKAERNPLLRLLSDGQLEDALHIFFEPFPSSTKLHFLPLETEVPAGTTLHISIGPKPLPGILTVWSVGWVVYLNSQSSNTATPNKNSIGACVAAGLAASDAFKRITLDIPLAPGLSIKPIENLIFSTFDYSLNESENPPLPTEINVDNTVIVGLGGIGAGLVAAATSLPSLSGKIILVDKDKIDVTNLNRHLIARPGDSATKVELCRKALQFHSDIEIVEGWFEDFTNLYGNKNQLIISCVDKDAVRREIQDSLPALILNAGTSTSASFQVSRHDYTKGACLACIAVDDLQGNPVERQLANQLGLDISKILDYQISGEPISETVLNDGGKLGPNEIAALGGQTLSEIQVKLCGEIRLGEGPEEEAVSISFLSALPGFLLLGELIKERSYPVKLVPLNREINHTFMSFLGYFSDPNWKINLND